MARHVATNHLPSLLEVNVIFLAATDKVLVINFCVTRFFGWILDALQDELLPQLLEPCKQNQSSYHTYLHVALPLTKAGKK